MKKILTIRLQLFAEGADGEAATAAGVANETQTADESEVAAQETAENEGQVAADNNEGEDLDVEFDGLIKGKFKNQFENAIKKSLNRRMKGTQKLREQIDAQQPIIDALKKRHGVEDIGELLKAVEEDALYIQKQSMETGESEESILSGIRSQRSANEIAKFKEEQETRQKISAWHNEAMNLKESVYPNLDLLVEMKNKEFMKLLDLGLPVKQAYEVIHHDDLVRSAVSYATAKTKKQTEDTIKAGANRPRENGMSSQAASKTTIDVNNLTEKDIMAIIKKVENGQKVIL